MYLAGVSIRRVEDITETTWVLCYYQQTNVAILTAIAVNKDGRCMVIFTVMYFLSFPIQGEAGGCNEVPLII